jgi:hypothetical protein
VTRKTIGRLHAEQQARGYVTSCPVSEPAWRKRVWVRKDDRAAPLMLATQAGRVVGIHEIDKQLGLPSAFGLPDDDLTLLGIAAVPHGDGCVRLIGTSPDVARIVNHVYHHRRRRHLTPEDLIEAVHGIVPDGRKTSVTDKRLLASLDYLAERFELDFSDLIDREPILV